jgi:hypothetical protein
MLGDGPLIRLQLNYAVGCFLPARSDLAGAHLHGSVLWRCEGTKNDGQPKSGLILTNYINRDANFIGL